MDAEHQDTAASMGAIRMSDIGTELQLIEAKLSELIQYMDFDEDNNDLRSARTHIRLVLNNRDNITENAANTLDRISESLEVDDS